MKKVSFCVLFFLTAMHGAYAQLTIRGRITSAAGKAVPDAIILLESAADTSLISTAQADSAGEYVLSATGATGRQLRVSAAGYAEQVRTLAPPEGPRMVADFILQPVSGALKGVTVTGVRPLFERKADRTIFNVSGSITAIGGNALDAIRKAPGVTVNAGSGTISLAGKSEVQVMVNGRLLQLSGEDLIAYLQTIGADNLDRIEVITTPPARYDAAGNSGLLHLVLKKSARAGANGDVRIGYEQAGYGKVIGGGSLNYRKDKLNVYANASYNEGANNINERLSTPYPEQLFRLTDHYKRQTASLQYTAGADYALHKTGVLGIELTGSDFRRTYYEDINIRAERQGTGALDSLVHTDAISTVMNRSNSLNLNYAWQIDTAGKKLTVNANHLWFASERQKDLDTRNYEGAALIPTGFRSLNRSTGEQQIGITTVQADVEWPLQPVNLSFGGKLSFVHNDSRNSFLYEDGGVYYNNPAISNAFSYNEQVQALYLSGQRTTGKWELQAGLRGEYTHTKGYSETVHQTIKNQYFNLFPTAYAQYTFNEHHVLNANYSKRVNRPGYRALDPFRAYSTPYAYIEGNPFLRPSFAHNAELNYVLKGRYTFSAFYQLTQNHFGQVFLVDTVHKAQNVRWENYADIASYGLFAMASLQPAKGWELQVQAGGFFQQIRSGYYTGTEQSYRLPTGFAVINNSIVLNRSRTLLAELNLFYSAKAQSDLLYLEPRGNLDAGIKALLLRKKLTLSLNAADILATDRTRGVNQANGQIIDSYFDARNVRIMVNYKFGNRKLPGRRERTTGIEDEKSRT